MLSAVGNETFRINNDPRPRHISPETKARRNSYAGRESLRTSIIVCLKLLNQLIYEYLGLMVFTIILFVYVKQIFKNSF